MEIISIPLEGDLEHKDNMGMCRLSGKAIFRL
jgi:redox-sensitive bicupin YhaK (pirin superfamily)